MAIQIQGNGGTVQEVDGTTFRAARVTSRPTDYGALGQYAIGTISGTMAAGMAAAGEIFQFRWTDATRLAAIYSVSIEGMTSLATGFTAGTAIFRATIARAWTADGSGGTAATLTGNNQKMRTSMGTSLAGTVRFTTTAALGAGTKTLDAQDFSILMVDVSTAVQTSFVEPGTDLWAPGSGRVGASDGFSPLILAANEGFVIRGTVPATGTWQIALSITWGEVASY